MPLRWWLAALVMVLWLHFGTPTANFFTNAGRDIVTNRVKGSGTEPVFGGWGTGAGAASATSTVLSTESRSTSTSGGNVIRATGTSSRVTTTVTNDTYQNIVTLTADAGKTITNAGLFDTDGAAVSPGPPTGGNLFVIADGLSNALNTNDSIQFTWKWQLT